MRINIPTDVHKIISALEQRGHEAYAVGGCVRDALLHKEPEDWDITTSALPEQVKDIFPRTIDTGIQHGTVTVLMHHIGYEVTTYRIDGDYADGRHPDSVRFTSDLLEDLKRRDFTVNAMAYGHETGIVDAFGGGRDLENRIIRCVGEPTDRFTEDALRILRAVRFSAQLGFEIEERTRQAAVRLSASIARVSKERVQAELTKTLLSPRPEKILLLYELGIIPWVSKALCGLNPEQITVSAQVPPVRHLRWAAFLCPLSPADGVSVLRELKLDNDTIHKVRTLLEWQDRPVGASLHEVRMAMSAMTPALYGDLLKIRMPLASGAALDAMEQAEDNFRLVLERGDCLSLKELAVSGKDLIRAGVKPGKQMGRILDELLNQVLEDPEKNVKPYLMDQIARKI